MHRKRSPISPTSFRPLHPPELVLKLREADRLIDSQRRGEMNIPYPGLAFFVLIRITPFAACPPYKAEAEAPFKTLKLSISSGFRLEIPSPASRLPASAVPPIVVKACSLLTLKIGTPSITYKGWLFPDANGSPG